jgi:hypothetical protein
VVNDRQASSTTDMKLQRGRNPSQYLDPLEFLVTVTGSMTGAVDIFDGTTRIAENLPLQSGRVVFPVSDLAPGTHTLVARFRGHGTVSGSSSAPLVQTVADGATVERTTIRLSAKAQGASVEGVEVEVVLSGGATGPLHANGAYNYVYLSVDGGAAVAVPLTEGRGNAAIALTKMQFTPGLHRLTAVYYGSPTHAGASATIEVQVR